MYQFFEDGKGISFIKIIAHNPMYILDKYANVIIFL